MTTYYDFDLPHGLDHPCHWADHLELPQYLQVTCTVITCHDSYFDVYFEGAYYLLETRFLDDINFLIGLYFYFDNFKDTGNYLTSAALQCNTAETGLSCFAALKVL